MIQWVDIPEGQDRKEGEVAGVAYRVLITTSEIYNEFIFERITLGPERCCVKVAWSRKLDMQKFCTSFKDEGECSGLEFTKWLSPVSFGFKLNGVVYQVLDVSERTVRIKRV